MVVRIVASDVSAPSDKVADAELVFEDGLLAGMKLVGFSIWRNQRRAIYSVTLPSRQYVVNGERRSYALLRPVDPGGSQEHLRLIILQAFAEYERQGAGPALSVEASSVEASNEEASRIEQGESDAGDADVGVS